MSGGRATRRHRLWTAVAGLWAFPHPLSCSYDFIKVRLDSHKMLLTQLLTHVAIVAAVLTAALPSIQIGTAAQAPEQYSTQIYVSASRGVSNESCWEEGESLPCDSLSLALVGAQRVSNSVAVVIELGDNVLSAVSLSTLILDSVSDFGIIGMDGNVRVNCEPGAGLIFTGSKAITVENVTFNECGINFSNENIFRTDMLPLRSAIYFILCEDVSISFTQIINSNGGGIAIHNTGGIINVRLSNFSLRLEDLLHDTKASGVTLNLLGNGTNGSYIFSECVFKGNKVANVCCDMPTSGGGLTIRFHGSSYGNQVTVESCIFDSNLANEGGGMFIQFKEQSEQNTVTIKSTNFSSNVADSIFSVGTHTSGGGAKVTFESDESIGNDVVFQDCTLYNNSAYLGGGISVSANTNYANSSTVNCINFTRCIFIENHADYGAAIDLYKQTTPLDYKKVVIIISDCYFLQNGMPYNKSFSRSFSVVNVNGLATSFTGTTIFFGSIGTPLAIKSTGTDLLDHSTLNFTQNTGYNGGALAFTSSGHLTVHNNTQLIFMDNSASVKGGAIYWEYFDEHFTLYSQQCFIRYYVSSVHPNEWNTTFQFSGNHVFTKSNTIFVSSLIPCVWRTNDHSTPEEDIKQTFCWDNWEYSDGNNCSSEIVTSPAYFEESSLSVTVFPGKVVTLPLQSFDDLDRNLSDITAYTAMSVVGSSPTADINSRFVTNNTITLYGVPNSTTNISIQSLDSRVVQAEVKIEFLSCPPGFVVEENSCVCGQGFGGDVICNEADFRAYLVIAACMTYEDQQPEVVRCQYTIEYARRRQLPIIPLPRNIYELTEAVCGPLNREGRLCSACKEGYGISGLSYSFDCVKCWESGAARWIAFIIAKFLPLTILFFLIMFFNVSVTSAPANAFIFFSQMVTIPRHMVIIEAALALSEQGSDRAISVIAAPYGIWNLDFFLTVIPRFCVSHGLKTPHLLVIDYIAAFYPLALIGFTYLCIKLHGRNFKPIVWLWSPLRKCFASFQRRWNFSTSIIDAIAAFLLLSYTKMIFISLTLLTPASVFEDDGTVRSRILWYDNSIPFFGGEHLYYAVPAVIILAVFTTMPPLLLLLYQFGFFLRCLEFLRLRSLALNTFVEVFQGCYKDGTNGTPDRRFFAGMYFVFRVIIFSLHTIPVSLTNYVVLLLSLQFVLTIGAILIIILEPYKVSFYNKLDATVFGILALAYAILLFIYWTFLLTGKIPSAGLAILFILVLLPLVYMVIFIFFKLLGYGRYWKQKLPKWMKKRHVSLSTEDFTSTSVATTSVVARSDLDEYSIPDRIVNPERYAHMSGERAQVVQLPSDEVLENHNTDEQLPVVVAQSAPDDAHNSSHAVPSRDDTELEELEWNDHELGSETMRLRSSYYNYDCV